MPKFSKTSLLRLQQCDYRLQMVCNKVIESFDFSVLEGHRNKDKQDYYFLKGSTKLKFPNSKHNQVPSMAVDIAPYPIDWKNKKSFYFLAGMMISTANYMGIELRWGGDWDGDFKFNDQSFNDLPHFEIK